MGGDGSVFGAFPRNSKNDRLRGADATRRVLPGFADYWRIFRHSGLRRTWAHFWGSHVFDLIHGTDTAHWRPKASHPSAIENIAHGCSYEASDTFQILRCIQFLGSFLRLSDYEFFDLGCGKGKVLLCASPFGFKKVVGIEYDPELSAIASRNVARMGVTAEVVCSDASIFKGYGDHAVLYLFNPFDDVLLLRVVRSLEQMVGEFIVVYVNPVHSEVFKGWRRLAVIPGRAKHLPAEIFRFENGG